MADVLKLNMRALLNGYTPNLRHVRRFSTSRCVVPENVAEHCFYVSFYAFAIADWALREKRIDLILIPGSLDLRKETSELQATAFQGEVAMRAVVHDLEEARSGDIHRPFKHSTPELHTALSAAGSVAFAQVIEQLLPDSDFTQQGSAAGSWLRLWQNAKDDTEAGRIVAFADFLSVLSYIMQEGETAVMRLNVDALEEHFSTLQDETYDFLRPLIDETGAIASNIFGAIRQKRESDGIAQS